MSHKPPGFQEYPKMLYHPNREPRTVNTANEERRLRWQGWVDRPDKAEQRKRWLRRASASFQFVMRHWKFWVTTAVALLGVYVAWLGVYHAWYAKK